jgi:hypothetical protein
VALCFAASYGLLVVGAGALVVGMVARVDAAAIFVAIVSLFGSLVLVTTGWVRRARATRTRPS